MKTAAVLCAMLVTFAACGDETEHESSTTVWDLCDHDGEACIREGYSGPRQGSCRSYKDAPSAFFCCAGCWEREYDFCHDGDEPGFCGEHGEDCSPAKCM